MGKILGPILVHPEGKVFRDIVVSFPRTPRGFGREMLAEGHETLTSATAGKFFGKASRLLATIVAVH
jgi:hypothetical protein